MTTKALTDYQCDCPDSEMRNVSEHAAFCGLTLCPAFVKGLVVWNQEAGALEYNIAFDPSELVVDELDRTPIADETFDTETFINVVMMQRIEDAVDIWAVRGNERPPNFSAFGVTWVWSTVHALWQAEPLGCYCGSVETIENMDSCDDCQVFRYDSGHWKQSQESISEDVCRCEPPAKFVCIPCGVGRNAPTEPWHSLSTINKPAPPPGKLLPTVIPCSHRGQHVELPDGLIVWASQNHSRKTGELIPDYAVYLDRAWTPECIATLLPWPDFGLPGLSLRKVLEVVDNTRQLLKQGYAVEVGCIGGHGRTGTFLSLLIVAGGTDHETAIEWVREKYCHKAVENERQEWYVEAFHCFVHGIPLLTPMPPDSWKMPSASGWNTGDQLPFDSSGRYKFPFPYCEKCEEPAPKGLYAGKKCDKPGCDGTII